MPSSITTLVECPDPPSKLPSPTFPRFGLYAEEEIPITLSAKEYAWLFARNLSREEETAGDAGIRQEEEEPHRSKVPVWSAYNSLVSPTLPVTRVSAPPLVAAPAHEWSTLLTVLQQAQGITAQVPF